MKKCRCKCRRAGGGRAMLAPTAKDQEVKRLKEELDEALDMLATMTEALRRLVRPEASGMGSPAPTAKGNRDVQTVKECQDWLISEYDLEVKRLTEERDKAIEELEFWGEAFAHETEDVGFLKAEIGRLKRDKQELLGELRRMKHENEMLWNYRVNRERKGY